MSKEIIKGDIVLQKEAELKGLQTEDKKVRRNLKSNNTRLNNDRERIATIQREISVATQEGHKKILSLQNDLLKVLETVQKSKKVPEEEKEGFDEMLVDLESEMPTEEEMQRMAEEFAKERANADYERRLYERFHKRPSTEDQKSIRNIYIKLSKRFHPDLAQNDKELAQFNLMMVRIVQAYESGDVAKLLEIEKEMVNHESSPSDVPKEREAVISFIQLKINRQINELNLLKGQLSRTRQELLELRNSEEGYMLADYKRCQKAGVDLIEGIKDGMQAQIKELQFVIKNLKKYAKTGKLPDELLHSPFMQSNPFFMEEEEDDFWEILEMLKDL